MAILHVGNITTKIPLLTVRYKNCKYRSVFVTNEQIMSSLQGLKRFARGNDCQK